MGLAVSGCSEKEDGTLAESAENMVLFEDLSMLDDVSSNPLDNHIYRIELLGNNESLEWFLARLEDHDINLSKYNIYGVKKHYMNHSDIIMYSMPRMDSDDILIVYAYEDLFQVMLNEINTLENGDRRHMLQTADGRLLYGLTINRAGEAGEFVKGQNAEMDLFSQQVARLKEGHGFGGRSMKKTKELDDEGCCRQMANWGECVECSLEYFSGTWYGISAFALIGPEFTASIGISCIGARPSAKC
jgi:hypothetical protein